MVRASTTEYSDAGGMVAPGRYLFLIESAVEDNAYGPQLVIETVILSGDQPSEIKKKFKDYLSLEGKAANRLHAILVATGITTKKHLAALRDNGKELEFDEMSLRGRSFCGEIQMEAYEGKDEAKIGKSFPKLGFRIWSVRDAAAKDIAKHPEAEKLMLVVLNKIDPLPVQNVAANTAASPVANPSNGVAKPAPPAPLAAAATSDVGGVDALFG